MRLGMMAKLSISEVQNEIDSHHLTIINPYRTLRKCLHIKKVACVDSLIVFGKLGRVNRDGGQEQCKMSYIIIITIIIVSPENTPIGSYQYSTQHLRCPVLDSRWLAVR